MHNHASSDASDRCCPTPTCDCNPPDTGPAALTRRAFVAAAGSALGGAILAPARAVAGPFAVDDLRDFPIPADKKFSANWSQSLFSRGEPTTYSSLRGELRHIGMPIGGICTGQLYLGGDGRLWHWDIFNLPAGGEWRSTAGPHYANPARPAWPIEQGFAVRVGGSAADPPQLRRLDSAGFREITFRGQYPIGFVEYRDAECPVAVSLEAFSPFIPLNEDDSGLPATIMSFTVKNVAAGPATVELTGWLQNAVCLSRGQAGLGARRNRARHEAGVSWLDCTAEPASETPAPAASPRADIAFERFESGKYEGWTTTGSAFGDAPVEIAKMPEYQGKVNAEGRFTVNTHNTRGGEDVGQADAHLGTLTSREFTIERDFITFRIGGGSHAARTCVNLLIDGAPLRSETGRNSNRMHVARFDVREFAGKTARIQVVDAVRGGWGQIAVDDIVFTDAPARGSAELADESDYGSMALGLLGDEPLAHVMAELPEGLFPYAAFERPADSAGAADATRLFGQHLIGAVSRRVQIESGESATFTFIVAWHFDGLWRESLDSVSGIADLRRHYGTRFKSAADVLHYVAANFERLSKYTRLWHRCWYDSSLPHWFLERTLANVSTLATSTCYRFSNGRFYGWEGTYCCAGTCQHVWQYAQAVARLFPNLERYLREQIDFGTSFHAESGALDYRGEAAKSVAHDGLAGTIVRAYREHLTSSDDAYLKRLWPKIRKSAEYLMAQDPDEDGVLEGAQYNTLDTTWYGPMGWISSLYLAAVRAAQAMADEMNDADFAARCRKIVERGGASMVEKLFNGEYFIHIPDPAHPEANATGDGCHIDQVFGQSMAHQVGLGRILPKDQTASALKALYKYSFAPDVGVYRSRYDREIKGGRWYAMPGEAGLLMCTWPRGGHERAAGKSGDAWAAGYFNECMSGFEHQVASHMIWEGMVEEGLAITRAIHERYHAARRNPFNEVECSDHYARAMASYGTFIAACGFEYHGPKGYIAFAPVRISPEFRAAFTAAEGWGTYFEEWGRNPIRVQIALAYGVLRLRAIRLAWPPETAAHLKVMLGGKELTRDTNAGDGGVLITLKDALTLRQGEVLSVSREGVDGG